MDHRQSGGGGGDSGGGRGLSKKLFSRRKAPAQHERQKQADHGDADIDADINLSFPGLDEMMNDIHVEGYAPPPGRREQFVAAAARGKAKRSHQHHGHHHHHNTSRTSDRHHHQQHDDIHMSPPTHHRQQQQQQQQHHQQRAAAPQPYQCEPELSMNLTTRIRQATASHDKAAARTGMYGAAPGTATAIPPTIAAGSNDAHAISVPSTISSLTPASHDRHHQQSHTIGRNYPPHQQQSTNPAPTPVIPAPTAAALASPPLPIPGGLILQRNALGESQMSGLTSPTFATTGPSLLIDHGQRPQSHSQQQQQQEQSIPPKKSGGWRHPSLGDQQHLPPSSSFARGGGGGGLQQHQQEEYNINEVDVPPPPHEGLLLLQSSSFLPQQRYGGKSTGGGGFGASGASGAGGNDRYYRENDSSHNNDDDDSLLKNDDANDDSNNTDELLAADQASAAMAMLRLRQAQKATAAAMAATPTNGSNRHVSFANPSGGGAGAASTSSLDIGSLSPLPHVSPTGGLSKSDSQLKRASTTTASFPHLQSSPARSVGTTTSSEPSASWVHDSTASPQPKPYPRSGVGSSSAGIPPPPMLAAQESISYPPHQQRQEQYHHQSQKQYSSSSSQDSSSHHDHRAPDHASSHAHHRRPPRRQLSSSSSDSYHPQEHHYQTLPQTQQQQQDQLHFGQQRQKPYDFEKDRASLEEKSSSSYAYIHQRQQAKQPHDNMMTETIPTAEVHPYNPDEDIAEPYDNYQRQQYHFQPSPREPSSPEAAPRDWQNVHRLPHEPTPARSKSARNLETSPVAGVPVGKVTPRSHSIGTTSSGSNSIAAAATAAGATTAAASRTNPVLPRVKEVERPQHPPVERLCVEPKMHKNNPFANHRRQALIRRHSEGRVAATGRISDVVCGKPPQTPQQRQEQRQEGSIAGMGMHDIHCEMCRRQLACPKSAVMVHCPFCQAVIPNHDGSISTDRHNNNRRDWDRRGY